MARASVTVVDSPFTAAAASGHCASRDVCLGHLWITWRLECFLQCREVLLLKTEPSIPALAIPTTGVFWDLRDSTRAMRRPAVSITVSM
jgi:hypothetical protein